MRILYGFSNCTDRLYGELFRDKPVSVLQPDQKYHGLLIRGLVANGAAVKCVSGLPVNRAVTKKLFLHEPDEAEAGAQYHYIKTVNLPFFRQAGIWFGSRRSVKKDCDLVLCDCLNLANAFGMIAGAKRRKKPVVLIVTDLPEFQRGKLLRRLNESMFKKADGFILLTEQMNEKINPEGKPYLVLEGHSDSALPALPTAEKTETKTGKQIVLYSGSLMKLYGIENLVQGFLAANLKNAELHIYGDGDYREELQAVCQTEPAIRYFGSRPNAEVVAAQQRAALLVNPRPSAPEYTKYSFPSKTMEYLASGTPALTTRLPGIPRDYDAHLNFIDDETPTGVAAAIARVLARPQEEREEAAARARTFVLEEKSNTVQAKKILAFCETLLKEKQTKN